MSRTPQVVVGLVAGSHVVNHAYLLLFAPAFPLLGEEFGASLAALGLTVGVVNAVVTAGQLPLGYVSDSYSHTAVLVGSLAVGTVGAALAALSTSYLALLAAAAVMGAGVAGHHPAHYPLISAAAPDAYRSRAYSVHGFAGAIGLAVPFAAVPAATTLGYGWRAAFGAVAALGAVYTVATVVVVRRIPGEIAHAGALAADEEELVDAPSTLGATARSLADRLREYVATLAGAPMILLLTALWFVNSVAVWGIRTYAATLLAAGYGLAEGTASLVASAMLVVGAVVLLGGGYLGDRVGPVPVLYAGYGSLVVLAGALASALLPVLAAVGAVLLLAATVDLSRPARATLTDFASARGDIGKNFALMTIGISIGGAVAPPAFGFVIVVASVEAAFLCIAATAALALGLSVAVARTPG
ncbi:MFS transporter [Halobacteriales archaeon QS_1_69_70]|nr:MAG: MFS transporter [Halobacteriales archaeon QS_1_69_70]